MGWLFDYLDTPFDYWDSVLVNLGKYKIAFRSIDDQACFWIAQQVANSKYTQDAWSILKEGTQIAGKKPDILISDGAPNFDSAYVKEYFTYAVTRTQHIRHIHLAGDHNNNKMERMNGGIHDRERTTRNFKEMILHC